MIKIPGTREGLPAVTHCIGGGINVNVTLLFAVERYREVAAAYQAGLDGPGRPAGFRSSGSRRWRASS